MPLLSFKNVSKSLPDGARQVAVLKEVSFDIDAGEYVGLWGSRRSGKSTVLELAAGVVKPDAGRIMFDGEDIARMSQDQRAHRRQQDGVALALLDWRPTRSRPVVEHVAIPLTCCGVSFSNAEVLARRTLKRVEASEVEDRMTDELALGERIRVELARALIREPRLLLVDEPALSASPSESRSLYALLRTLGREEELAVVIASTEAAAIQGAPRIFTVDNGRVRWTDSRRKVLPFRRAGAEPSAS
jgi:ABC-type lipoprotein export system ATPase subunit